jgi:GNAT superfamily N-acetyltransferase
MDAQIADFRQRWDVTQVRIITLDGTDIGWLQSLVKDDALFLGLLFVDGALRRQGIGTEVVKGLIEEEARAGQALTRLDRSNAYRAVRKAAAKMAVKVGRVWPGGDVWRLRGEK